MYYTMAVLLTCMMMISAVPAQTHVDTHGVNLEIVSDEGGRFTTIPFRDFRKGKTQVIKRYLEAMRGENYSLVIRNNTAERIGVVIAVDGRNIITGKKSSLKRNEMMYIVQPHDSTKLEGWRTDPTTVHGFYFTDESDSYAQRTFRDSSAMGVIAVAVFHEKESRWRQLQKRSGREERSGAPAPSSAREMEADKSDAAGTGFGDERYSPTVNVEFKPERRPFQKILVKYEWRDVLCNKGILKCEPEEKNRLWDEEEYAPYPPGYHKK